jgi:MFS family permease
MTVMLGNLGPLVALLASTGLFVASHGLQTFVVPVRAAVEAFSSFGIGVIGSAFFTGFVVGCLAVPHIIRRAGHVRVFTALVAVAAAAALLPSLGIDIILWVVARLITGFAMAGLYLVIESWINSRARNENRGGLMAIYLVTTNGAMTIGQLAASLWPIDSAALFSVAAILMSLAAVPIAMTRTDQPAPVATVQFRPVKLYRTSPVGFVGAFVVGVANSSFWTFGPGFATAAGMTIAAATWFMSLAIASAAAMQTPVGRISDRVDRRYVLIAVLSVAAITALVLGLMKLPAHWMLVLVAVFGAFGLQGYSLCAAHAYDHAAPTEYVETAAGLLLANGAGSIIGPVFGAMLIGAIGQGGTFVAVAIPELLLVAFVIYRMQLRASPAADAKTKFTVAPKPIEGAAVPLQRDAPTQTVAGDKIQIIEPLEIRPDERRSDAAR